MTTQKPNTPDFKDIVESLNDMIYELDPEGKFYYANSTLERLSGYSKQELQHMYFWDLVKKDHIDELNTFYKKQRNNRIDNTYYEFIMVSKTGQEIWVGQNVKMIYDESGVVSVRAVARDITTFRALQKKFEKKALALKKANEKQKAIQKDLEQRNALTDMILNTMAEAVVVVDNKGEFILFNEAAKIISVKGQTDIGPHEWSAYYGAYYADKQDKLIPTDELPLVQSLKGEEVHNYEAYVKNEEMAEGIYVLFNSRPLKNRNGEIIGALLVTTNIDEQKQSEQSFKKSEEKFRAMSDASPLGIIVIDKEGSCQYSNFEVQKLIGINFEKILGSGWISAIHEDDIERVFIEWDKAIKKNEVLDIEHRFVKPKGQNIWVNTKASPMVISGEIVGYVGTVEDITSRKQYEKELLKAKDLAEEASQAKADFLSNMSHELRTPLNAVIGMAHLLQDGDPLPHQREYLNVLRFSADNLLMLINDILDYNKIESGEISIEKVEVNLRQLVSNIQKAMSLNTKDKGLDFTVNIDSEIPKLVLTDQIRLSQVLTNLVSNAIKFTDEGFINVDLEQKSKTKKSVTVCFYVKDSGIGISEAHQQVIFDRFKQAEEATTRKYGGSGLGLAISKKLVELLEGKINLESKIGEGSSFSFTLTFARVPAKKKTQDQQKQGAFPSSLAGVRMLVAEDNQINQMVATKFLHRWDIVVETADNGKEAIEKLRAAHFDLVLMDLQMPIMDGFEATRQIRADKKIGKIPIMALTASALSEEKDSVFKVGMNDFITKPFDPQELYAKIARIIGHKSPQMTSAKAPTVSDSKPLVSTKKAEILADGDLAFLEKIYVAYIHELKRLIIIYRDIVKTRDIELYRSIKHKTTASFELFEARLLQDEMAKTKALIESNDSLKLSNHFQEIKRISEAISQYIEEKMLELQEQTI